MRQSASGANWRAMRTAVAAASAARPDLASRGRGCGNRLRRNTRHENNRNSECTSEARRRRVVVGASETRINTRLFTYGVRARGYGLGRGGQSPAIRTLQLLLCTTQFHPNSSELKTLYVLTSLLDGNHLEIIKTTAKNKSHNIRIPYRLYN